MDGIEVPRDLIGSTYTDEELITTLYLENARLRSLVPEQAKQAEREPVSRAAVARDSEYALVREYAEIRRRRRRAPRHLVVANEYPNYGAEYGNGFVHRRVRAYIEAGVEVDVIAYGKRRRRGVYRYDGVDVLSGYVAELDGMLATNDYDSISVHFLNAEMWTVLRAHLAITHTPLYVFVHGYEADRWIRRAFDVTDGDRLTSMIDRTFQLQRFWRGVVESRTPPTHYVFVSNFWRDVVEEDMDVHFPPDRTAIIHNVIDTELFPFRQKTEDDRFRILWVRSAATKKYGADLAADALRLILESRHGEQVRATIIGDGAYFHEFERAFGDDRRVHIERRFASQAEISTLHSEHGLFLVPTRLDSQGVSRDEAMSSGLVPITNAVTAIPEFVDEECAILAPSEDSAGLASRVIDLMDEPERFLAMSRAAAARVRRQCGPSATVERELSLMGLLEGAE